jgi:hypothetical protein
LAASTSVTIVAPSPAAAAAPPPTTTGIAGQARPTPRAARETAGSRRLYRCRAAAAKARALVDGRVLVAAVVLLPTEPQHHARLGAADLELRAVHLLAQAHLPW